MAKRNHWGHALTAIGLVGTLAGCSTKMSDASSASAVKVDPSKIGLAMRAQAALASGDLGTALALAEEAVEYRPKDASFRALLGNIYLASGRYASAESAYHDALVLAPPDAQVVLKYTLVQIAQGKSERAIAMLSEAQSLLDPADLGLALALAGRAEDAVAVLEPAARQRGADARLRQNLALAHALGGNWTQARIVAAQDLGADQVDARIAEWLSFARPGQAGAQVAAFIGVQPAASDPGQPVRLALGVAPVPVRQVAADPVSAPAPIEVAAPASQASFEAAVEVAEAQPPVPVSTPVVASAPPSGPPATLAATAPRPALTPAAVRLTQTLPELRRNAAVRQVRGQSGVVVQLGAFNKREFVAGAWTRVAGQHAKLRNYVPVTARYDGANGVFYRLSVKGFASSREAIDLCQGLKRAGAKCFVRAASNDAPVRLASR